MVNHFPWAHMYYQYGPICSHYQYGPICSHYQYGPIHLCSHYQYGPICNHYQYGPICNHYQYGPICNHYHIISMGIYVKLYVKIFILRQCTFNWCCLCAAAGCGLQ